MSTHRRIWNHAGAVPPELLPLPGLYDSMPPRARKALRVKSLGRRRAEARKRAFLADWTSGIPSVEAERAVAPGFFAMLAGGLVLAAQFAPWLAWVALVPLLYAVHARDWRRAACYGALFSWAMYAPMALTAGVAPGSFLFKWMILSRGALCWALGMAAYAYVTARRPGTWGLWAFPLFVVGVHWAVELTYGRIANPLAWTQGEYLAVLHVSRLGSHYMIDAIIALAAVILYLAIHERDHRENRPALVGATAVLAGVLAIGELTAFGMMRALDNAPRVRVAAVAPQGGYRVSPVELFSGLYAKTVDEQLRVYQPLVERAVAAGAEVIVLPEAHVFMAGSGRQRWIDTVSPWAAEHDVWIVAGYYDTSTMQNRAMVISPEGQLEVNYVKQRPVPYLEYSERRRMAPGKSLASFGMLSTFICFDQNFAPLSRQVVGRGGLVAVPTHDWWEVAATHHALAPLNAVSCQTGFVRATNAGVSSIHDAAGRELAFDTTWDHDAFVIADLPVLRR